MDDKKKYPRRRRYLKDFKPNADGSYSYRGKMLQSTLAEDVYKQTLKKMLAVAAVVLIPVFAAGCVRGTGMEGCFYLLLPYVGTLLILIRMIWNLAQLLYHGPQIREYVYKNTGERLPAQLLFGTVFPVITLAGLVYARIRGTYQGSGFGAVLFVTAHVAAIIGCQVIRHLGKDLAWL